MTESTKPNHPGRAEPNQSTYQHFAHRTNEISTQTIIILIIIVTLISVATTLTLLTQFNKAEPMPTESKAVTSGKVQLTILDPTPPQPSDTAINAVLPPVKND